jgi:hypothetical protein
MAYDLGALIDSTKTVTVHSAVPHGEGRAHGALAAVALRKGPAADPPQAKAFHELAAACRRIRHFALLPVEHVFESEGRPVAVGALAPGAPLSRLLDVPASRATPLDLRRAARVVLDAASALGVVHAVEPAQRPLAHFSADAVWVSIDGRAVVLPSARCEADHSDVTAPCASRAWARYQAPELDRGERAESADVYSLAVLLWDLLALGRAGTPDDLRDATRLGPDWLDGAIAELVMRSLSTDPTARPRDPNAFAAELARALSAPTAIPAPMMVAHEVIEYECTLDDTEDALTAALPAPRAVETPFFVVPPNPRFVSEAPSNRVSPRSVGPAAAPPAVLRVVGGVTAVPGMLRLGVGPVRKWVVGRASTVDLVLADPDMSRAHFAIVREGDGGYRVRDLGSKNGLFVNGQVATELSLRPGDELLAGGTRLRFEA